MAAGVTEIHSAATVAVVDLAGPAQLRIGPVLHSALTDSAVDRVEVVLGNQECVVLWSNVVAAVGEIEADAVIEFHRQEMAHGLGGRQAEQFCEEGGRLSLVVG